MFLYKVPCCHVIFIPSANTSVAALIAQTFCATFSDAVTLRFSVHCCLTRHQEIHELKDQIQDVETKYMQNLKEVKV